VRDEVGTTEMEDSVFGDDGVAFSFDSARHDEKEDNEANAAVYHFLPFDPLRPVRRDLAFHERCARANHSEVLYKMNRFDRQTWHDLAIDSEGTRRCDDCGELLFRRRPAD